MSTVFVNRESLQALLLAELRATPGCAGATAVVVRRIRDKHPPENWEISTFDSGTSDSAACKKALAEIYARQLQRYELIGKG